MTEYYVVYDSATGAEAYRGQGPIGAAAVQQLAPELAALVVPAAAFTSHPLDLTLIKSSYAEAIDLAADKVRSMFITNTPGQMATYLEKEAEARGILVGSGTPTPFLTAEASAIGVDVEALAQEVVAQADAWRIIGARIEATRRKAKVDLARATQLIAIQQAVQVDWGAVVAPELEPA